MRVAIPLDWGSSVGMDPSAWPGLQVVPYAVHELLRADRRFWAGVEALIPPYPGPSARVLRGFPDLRVISVPSTGVSDYLDVDAVTRLGVAVCNVPDYGSDSIAEFTLGLAIALARRIPEADRAMRSGQWPAGQLMGMDLRGKVLGVAGFGSVGSRVASLAAHIGMDVISFTRRPKSKRPNCRVEFVTWGELLERADVVSLHLSLTNETRGLLDREGFRRMKTGALLVNTARGALIDTNALVDALKAGRLAGAALDVAETEPPPLNHPLALLENVIRTPHMAALTPKAELAALTQCLENLLAFGQGQPINVVNPEALTRPP